MNVPKHWRENARRYRLEAGKCTKCGAVHLPARLICPECGNEEFDRINLSGRGEIETFTIIRTAPSGFTDFAPYAVVVVALDEGVSILGQITDCDPDALKAGDRVASKFRRMNEEGKTGMIMYSYKFVPDLNI
jgi:uncharacterized OB-fold protein